MDPKKTSERPVYSFTLYKIAVLVLISIGLYMYILLYFVSIIG